jgi:hypothetical protein
MEKCLELPSKKLDEIGSIIAEIFFDDILKKSTALNRSLQTLCYQLRKVVCVLKDTYKVLIIWFKKEVGLI